MTVDDSRILWSCINCGHIWGTPKPAEGIPVTDANDTGGLMDDAGHDANRFDDYVQRLRAVLDGSAARLGRLASQLEDIAACVFIADDAGQYIAANDRACALTGYSRAELLRRSVAGLTAPNEFARYERLWDSFMGSMKQHGVYNIVRKDGGLVKVRYVAYTDLAPGIHISFIVEGQAPSLPSPSHRRVAPPRSS